MLQKYQRRPASILWYVVGLLLACITSSSHAVELTGKRVALVIGNTQYGGDMQLKNPGNDADLIVASLKLDGFDIVGGKALKDLDRAQFKAAIKIFGSAAQNSEIAFFYYAGHGLQVSGSNWLVPIRTNVANVKELGNRLIAANSVIQYMQDSGAELKIVVLDTCRQAAPLNASGFSEFPASQGKLSPYAGGSRAYGESLTAMIAPDGMIIAYSTQPGGVASDGYGQYGPYARILSNVLRMPNLDIFNIFNNVGVAVRSVTNGGQQPWFSSAPIEGNFVLYKENSIVQNPRVSMSRSVPTVNLAPYSNVEMPIYVDEYPFSTDPGPDGRCTPEELHLRKANRHVVCVSTIIEEFPDLRNQIFVSPIHVNECPYGYTFYRDDQRHALCIVDAINVTDTSFKSIDPVPKDR